MDILAFQQCKYARISPKAILHLQSLVRSSQYQVTRLNIEIKHDSTQFKGHHNIQTTYYKRYHCFQTGHTHTHLQ